MELQVGVKAIARNKEGKYLLLRRSAKNYPGARGVWDWDIVGGRIDAGISLRENLIREIREETGLIFNGPMKLLAAQDIFPDEKDRHVVRLTYMIELDGEPKLDLKEHEEFAWVAPEELKTWEGLDFYVRELVEEGVFASKYGMAWGMKRQGSHHINRWIQIKDAKIIKCLKTPT
ncbi:MAG: NUDIX domain-containing protein, partial [Patescibacteria group bacterium]